MKLTKTFLAAMIILTATLSGLGQERKPLSPKEQQRFVVSARAGAVNLIEGNVSYKRGAAGWNMLIVGDELLTGDLVKTEANSNVEVLLNPGSYLRLAQNTEFVFIDTTLDSLKIEIVKGSAIIEASLVEAPFMVFTPKSEVSIVRNGIYRIDVGANGRAEVAVRKGRIMIAGTKVRDGKKVALDGGEPVLTAFDKKAQDEFDTWSKTRAKTLVAANRSLSERALNRGLAASVSGNIWLFNPSLGCYTFLPGYYGLSSPYGGYYTRCARCYGSPYPGYYDQGGNGWNTGGGSPASGGGAAGGSRNGGNGSGSGGTVRSQPVYTEGGGHKYKEPVGGPEYRKP